MVVNLGRFEGGEPPSSPPTPQPPSLRPHRPLLNIKSNSYGAWGSAALGERPPRSRCRGQGVEWRGSTSTQAPGRLKHALRRSAAVCLCCSDACFRDHDTSGAKRRVCNRMATCVTREGSNGYSHGRVGPQVPTRSGVGCPSSPSLPREQHCWNRASNATPGEDGKRPWQARARDRDHSKLPSPQRLVVEQVDSR